VPPALLFLGRQSTPTLDSLAVRTDAISAKRPYSDPSRLVRRPLRHRDLLPKWLGFGGFVATNRGMGWCQRSRRVRRTNGELGVDRLLARNGSSGDCGCRWGVYRGTGRPTSNCSLPSGGPSVLDLCCIDVHQPDESDAAKLVHRVNVRHSGRGITSWRPTVWPENLTCQSIRTPCGVRARCALLAQVAGYFYVETVQKP
jgi:hypothetical protein